MAHVADRILAAIKSRLAAVSGIAGVHLLPLHLLDSSQLPAIVIDGVEDSVEQATGYFPVFQTRKLQIPVKVCVMATEAAFDSAVATLHEAAAVALTGSESAINLGGLLTRGLSITSERLFADAESLQKPVGGWEITVTCTYNTRSDQPGHTEKELT